MCGRIWVRTREYQRMETELRELRKTVRLRDDEIRQLGAINSVRDKTLKRMEAEIARLAAEVGGDG